MHTPLTTNFHSKRIVFFLGCWLFPSSPHVHSFVVGIVLIGLVALLPLQMYRSLGRTSHAMLLPDVLASLHHAPFAQIWNYFRIFFVVFALYSNWSHALLHFVHRYIHKPKCRLIASSHAHITQHRQHQPSVQHSGPAMNAARPNFAVLYAHARSCVRHMRPNVRGEIRVGQFVERVSRRRRRRQSRMLLICGAVWVTPYFVRNRWPSYLRNLLKFCVFFSVSPSTSLAQFAAKVCTGARVRVFFKGASLSDELVSYFMHIPHGLLSNLLVYRVYSHTRPPFVESIRWIFSMNAVLTPALYRLFDVDFDLLFTYLMTTGPGACMR